MLTTKRMTGESPQAYEAWRTYAEMGRGRTLNAVGLALSKSSTIIKRWSSRHGWKERIALWDNEDAERHEAAAQRAADTVADAQAKLRAAVQSKAAEGFKTLWAKAELILSLPLWKTTTQRHPVNLLTKKAREQYPEGLPLQVVEPVNCRPSDAAKFIELADALGRLAAGMPSKVTGISDVEGKPFTIPQPQPHHIEQYVVKIGYRDADERDSTERLLDDIVKRQSEIVR
jgi:hypothetical protein